MASRISFRICSGQLQLGAFAVAFAAAVAFDLVFDSAFEFVSAGSDSSNRAAFAVAL